MRPIAFSSHFQNSTIRTMRQPRKASVRVIPCARLLGVYPPQHFLGCSILIHVPTARRRLCPRGHKYRSAGLRSLGSTCCTRAYYRLPSAQDPARRKRRPQSPQATRGASKRKAPRGSVLDPRLAPNRRVWSGVRPTYQHSSDRTGGKRRACLHLVRGRCPKKRALLRSGSPSKYGAQAARHG